MVALSKLFNIDRASRNQFLAYVKESLRLVLYFRNATLRYIS